MRTTSTGGQTGDCSLCARFRCQYPNYAISRAAAGSTGDSGDVTGDNDKRDILDLLKLSYIVVRTGIGTGQIMVSI